MTQNTVLWPCLLKLEGDDELIYLPSITELHTECESLIWSKEDYVVDSEGRSFRLRYDNDKRITLSPTDNVLSVEEVTALIQCHEFSQAQRCIIKIQFASVQQAVLALSSQ